MNIGQFQNKFLLNYLNIEFFVLFLIKMDTQTIEKKWQQKWKDEGAWDVRPDSSKEKFFGNFAYPYANSVMHIGHGRTISITDVFLRYQRLRGKNVLYPLGYHISGTPVLAVADGVKRGDEKTLKQVRDAISDYISDEKEQDKLIETFTDPQNIADFFSQTIEGSLDSIGVGITYERKFTTGEPYYNAFIQWQYEKLKQNGLLKQGKYPILYSAQDENAVGEDDIKDGDIDKVGLSEMSYIMFKIEGTEEYLVAGTLRPDALFGITNMYVKPDMKLVKLNVDGDIWIVSQKSQVKIEHQFDDVEVISEHLGSEFIGKNVIAPIIDKKVPIIAASFCDENHATGIVFSSPADSVHDYLHLFEHRFPGKSLEEFSDSEPLELTPITETFDKKGQKIPYKFDIPAYSKLVENKVFKSEGNEEKLEEMKKELYKESHFGAKMMNCGDEFNGTPLKGNVGFNKTKQKLADLNLGGTFYETTRRATTRGGDDVIVANLSGQWFLDYSAPEIKEKALALMDYMIYEPENLRQTQIGYVNWANLRPCARKRGLGTKLPYDENWVIEPLSDSTIYQMLYMIMHVIRDSGVEPTQLNYDFFDYVYLGNGDLDFVSSNSGVDKGVIENCRKEVKYWNNVDFRYTAWGHMSNHLNFLIYHYSIIFPQEMWPKQICVGQFMMRNGEKISKSKGNGTPLFRVKDIYGADLYRLYLIVSSNFDVEMDFRDDDVEQVKKKFMRIQEIISNAISAENVEYDSFNETQKWLVAKFYSRVQEAFSYFEEVKLREAYVTLLFEFMNDLNYALRRIGEEQFSQCVRFFVEDLIKVLTPVTPHICEEFWEQLGNDSFVSLESLNLDSKLHYVSDEILGREEIIEKLSSEIARIKEENQKRGDNVKKLYIVVAPESKFKLFEKIDEMRSNNSDIKEMLKTLNSEFSQDSKFIAKFVPKTFKSGLHFYVSRDEEKKLYDEASSFFKEEFSIEEVVVIDAENSEMNVGNNCLPARAIIYFK